MAKFLGIEVKRVTPAATAAKATEAAATAATTPAATTPAATAATAPASTPVAAPAVVAAEATTIEAATETPASTPAATAAAAPASTPAATTPAAAPTPTPAPAPAPTATSPATDEIRKVLAEKQEIARILREGRRPEGAVEVAVAVVGIPQTAEEAWQMVDGWRRQSLLKKIVEVDCEIERLVKEREERRVRCSVPGCTEEWELKFPPRPGVFYTCAEHTRQSIAEGRPTSSLPQRKEEYLVSCGKCQRSIRISQPAIPGKVYLCATCSSSTPATAKSTEVKKEEPSSSSSLSEEEQGKLKDWGDQHSTEKRTRKGKKDKNKKPRNSKGRFAKEGDNSED